MPLHLLLLSAQFRSYCTRRIFRGCVAFSALFEPRSCTSVLSYEFPCRSSLISRSFEETQRPTPALRLGLHSAGICNVTHVRRGV